MKKTLLLLLLAPLACFSQDDETFKPHLEKKNELRVSIENYLTTIEYERQINDHFSLGAIYKKGNGPEYAYSDFNLNETLHIGIKGRYYFKHFITHSFLYLFFDDNVKVRYYAETNLGYSRSIDPAFSERYLDDDSNYVIHRVTNQKSNYGTGTIGAGLKILYSELFTFEFSFGGGQVLTHNTPQDIGYVRAGIGFRF